MKKLIRHNCNPRIQEYYDYLDNHISCVKRSWYEMLLPAMKDSGDYLEEVLDECTDAVEQHDDSKYEPDEFYAYLNYFYPAPGYPKDNIAFDWAWLLHQRRNPHHWQHFVLIRDSGDTYVFDMPLAAICNMLCDWHSFSSKNPDSTAYAWYQENKDNMLLSDETRKVVESLITYLKDPLT